MRTKTLLIAAAAMAMGVASSSAQTVYSQNVVGYANVATTSAGANYLITCPFKIGSSNGINEIFTPAPPDFSQVLAWNFGSQAYDVFLSDSSSPSGWDDGNFTPLTTLPTFPVGIGFFLNPSAPTTNTFAGAIAVNVGSSNKMVLSNAGANYLVASAVPYAGALTNGNPVTGVGGPNLGPNSGTPDFTQVLIWNFGSQAYDVFLTDSSSPSGYDDGNFTPLSAPPSISVGQGLFINPSGAFNWTVGL